MSLDCNELVNSSRFISQRQYKRKLKRECPSYATMDRSKASKRSITKKNTSSPPSSNKVSSSGGGEIESEMDLKMKMVSKTTFKLREADFSANSEDELELMEIPLSPTHYQQPPTPDHEPPSPFQAERTILKVLDNLRNVCETNLVLHMNSKCGCGGDTISKLLQKIIFLPFQVLLSSLSSTEKFL